MMIWTKHLKTEAERTRFENSVRSAKPVIDRLYQMLEEDEAEIERSELTLDTYSTPNWAEKQAHKNGQRAVIRKLKNLLNLDQQKEPQPL